MKTKEAPKRVVVAKIPTSTMQEVELPASPADSSMIIQSRSRDENCAADFGSPPRLTLVAGTSSLAEFITPGQWALNNNLGTPVALGTEILILPLSKTKWWLKDFGQDDVPGAPVRFLTEAEVREYGGTTTNEPGKITFSRSMELHLLLADNEKADQTYLRLTLTDTPHLVALYEAARSAFRGVGVGLNLHWHNTGELPYQRRWKFRVIKKENRALKSLYHVPTLTRGEPVSATEKAELEKLIDRQLLH